MIDVDLLCFLILSFVKCTMDLEVFEVLSESGNILVT